MSPKPVLYASFITAVLCHAGAYAQDTARVEVKKFRQYKRTFQISLFPGISSNGVSSEFYHNKYSLNLFGGTSGGNEILEIGIISNSNLRSSTGIQLAGLTNVVGANAFVNLTQSEERALIIKDDFSVNFQGIQFAGILNYVLNGSRGIMLTGGLNVAGEDFSGVQIAGIGNSAAGTSQGIHLAGFYNVVNESMAGIQISALFNFTDEELSGTQIALINKSRRMMGRHATPPTRRKGLQVGLINFSKDMHGTQIGLINFGGEVRGKQFGLINFFQRVGSKENVRMGTPVGLLNFGSRGSYVRLHFSELFATTLEYSTGNCLNCSWTQSTMPFDDQNKILNQNVLILGYDHWRQTWGFGYGFQKLLYNKATMLPKPTNEKRLMTYGIKFIHLNRHIHFDRDFNLVTRLNFEWGKRRSFYYWFVGLSLNYFMFEEGEEQPYQIESFRVSTGNLAGLRTSFWPGYSVGVQL